MIFSYDVIHGVESKLQRNKFSISFKKKIYRLPHPTKPHLKSLRFYFQVRNFPPSSSVVAVIGPLPKASSVLSFTSIKVELLGSGLSGIVSKVASAVKIENSM